MRSGVTHFLADHHTVQAEVGARFLRLGILADDFGPQRERPVDRLEHTQFQRTERAGLFRIGINVFARGPPVDRQSQHTVIMALRGVEDQLAGAVPFDGKPQLDEIADLARSHEQVIGP